MIKFRKFFGVLMIVALIFVLPVMTFAQPGGIGNGNDNGGGIGNSSKLENPLKNVGSLTEFVRAVLTNIVLPIGSIVIVFFIIYAGFLFVTARGNESKLEHAKHTLLWVLVGAAILLGSWVIAEAISGTLCQITRVPGLCN